MPATLPVQFSECVVFLSDEFEAYRPQLGGVIMFDARLDPALLDRALRLLLVAEPILAYAFDPDLKRPMWRRVEHLDQIPLLYVRDSSAPDADAAAFVATRMDPTAGLGIAAMLLRGTEGDTLAVRVSHVTMDGGGLKEALYLLANIYQRLHEDPGWAPEPNTGALRHATTDAGLLEKLRLLSKSKFEILPESDWHGPDISETGPARYVRATVEPDVLKRAAALGRPVGATVNDILVAAYYRTLFRVLGPAPGSRTPLMMTVDLRKHLPPGTRVALANLSSTWTIRVPPVDSEDFDATLARVVEATREWKETDAGRANAVADAIGNRLIGRRALGLFRKQFEKVATAGDGEARGTLQLITNIGVIDEEKLDFGDAPISDAWLLGPIVPRGVGVVASTYRDKMSLSHGTEFSDSDVAVVMEVVEGTAAEIESWVQGSRVGVA